MDGRCDVWAVGVMLYESLTGRRPFRDEDEIQFRDPKPPRQIDDTIPESLQRICLTCLAKSAENRYATADALGCELHRACQDLAGGGDVHLSVTRDEAGNAVISGHGNVLVFQPGGLNDRAELPHPTELAPNPYQGLLAFEETDADRFFGREEQTDRLYNQLCALCERTTDGKGPLRVLPVLGPSGCGKSSLVRAGLIATLARRPLPGWKDARVAVFTPGARPIERLAGAIARVATDSPVAINKAAEFERLIVDRADDGQYDGLRRIADWLPDAGRSPLILLVDQFEEIYSLCDDPNQRTLFIENLLHAATAPSGEVVVILTLRSDFLGTAQDHEQLNCLISQYGLITPAMTEQELRRAIAEPARKAGHPLEMAVVELMMEQARDREGALPLLQFALSQIWEGITQGVEPLSTLEQIGGVGGALAGEAERIYCGLNSEDRIITRRVFLNLLQLGEGTRHTRRQSTIEEMVTGKDNADHIRQVVARFVTPAAHLITLSGAPNGIETIQVSHEAIFDHWKTLQNWISDSRDDIRFQRRLEEAARYWTDQGRPAGLLSRAPDLDILGQFHLRCDTEMTPLQLQFYDAAKKVAHDEHLWKRRRAAFGEADGLGRCRTVHGDRAAWPTVPATDNLHTTSGLPVESAAEPMRHGTIVTSRGPVTC